MQQIIHFVKNLILLISISSLTLMEVICNLHLVGELWILLWGASFLDFFDLLSFLDGM